MQLDQSVEVPSNHTKILLDGKTDDRFDPLYSCTVVYYIHSAAVDGAFVVASDTSKIFPIYLRGRVARRNWVSIGKRRTGFRSKFAVFA